MYFFLILHSICSPYVGWRQKSRDQAGWRWQANTEEKDGWWHLRRGNGPRKGIVLGNDPSLKYFYYSLFCRSKKSNRTSKTAAKLPHLEALTTHFSFSRTPGIVTTTTVLPSSILTRPTGTTGKTNTTTRIAINTRANDSDADAEEVVEVTIGTTAPITIVHTRTINGNRGKSSDSSLYLVPVVLNDVTISWLVHPVSFATYHPYRQSPCPSSVCCCFTATLERFHSLFTLTRFRFLSLSFGKIICVFLFFSVAVRNISGLSFFFLELCLWIMQK